MTARLIGIIGGIATGKTLLASFFQELGVPVIDTDHIAKELVAPHTAAWQSIAGHFGPDILQPDQHINRAKLRKLIFANPEQRHWLEALLHPVIRKTVLERAQALTAPYAIVLIPLLKQREDYPLSQVILMDAPTALQIDRLMTRDGIDASLATTIIASQPSAASRRTWADVVMDASLSPDLLRAQVKLLDAQFKALA